jgi:hypothetical protein
MVVTNNEIDVAKTACGGEMQGASPDEAQPGLHSKPMDAAIG